MKTIEELLEEEESTVKEKVKRILKAYGCYWDMHVPSGYGKPTLDFVCCCRGRYFAIETKRYGKHATKRQRDTSDEMIKAGGAVFFIEGTESLAFNSLRRFLDICVKYGVDGFLEEKQK